MPLDITRFITPGTNPAEQGQQMLRGLSGIAGTLQRSLAMADQRRAADEERLRQEEQLKFEREREARLGKYQQAMMNQAKAQEAARQQEAADKKAAARLQKLSELNAKVGEAVTSLDATQLPTLVNEARLNGVRLEYAEDAPEQQQAESPQLNAQEGRTPLPSYMVRQMIGAPPEREQKPLSRRFSLVDEETGEQFGEFDVDAIESQRMQRIEAMGRQMGLTPAEMPGFVASMLPATGQTKQFLDQFNEISGRALSREKEANKMERIKENKRYGGGGGGAAAPQYADSNEVNRGQMFASRFTGAFANPDVQQSIQSLNNVKRLLSSGRPVDVAEAQYAIAKARDPTARAQSNQDINFALGDSFMSFIDRAELMLSKAAQGALPAGMREQLLASVDERLALADRDRVSNYENAKRAFPNLKTVPGNRQGFRTQIQAAFPGLYKADDFYIPEDDAGVNPAEVQAIQQKDEAEEQKKEPVRRGYMDKLKKRLGK